LNNVNNEEIELYIKKLITLSKILNNYKLTIIPPENNPFSIPHFAYEFWKIELNGIDRNEDISLLYKEIKEIHESLQKSTFSYKRIELHIKGTINKLIEIEKYEHYPLVIFKNCNIKAIHISNQKDIKITNWIFKSCTIDAFYLIGKIENCTIQLIESCSIGLFSIFNCELNGDKDSKIYIARCKINNLLCFKTIFNIPFTLIDIGETIETSMDDCIFNKEVLLNNLTLKPNNFMFRNVFFNNHTSFKKSVFSNLNLNTVYFSYDKNIDFSSIKIQNYKSIDRYTARTIKFYLEKSFNKIEANTYHAYEMMSRKKELKWGENFTDKLIFSLNEQVSNHGLNWTLPLFWMLFIGLYYSGILYSSEFNLDAKILSVITPIMSLCCLFFLEQKDIGRYITALIPALLFYLFLHFTHGFDFNNLVKFISFISIKYEGNISLAEITLSKTIMGYLGYQLIVAVRKDTRK